MQQDLDNVMGHDTTLVEFTYDELLHQNKRLSAELAQCQREKEFIWGLWKRLQKENPDVTEAISKVVEREQERSDEKDLKVLTILQQKDQQIKILQDISADLKFQLKQANERLSDILVEQAEWNDSKEMLQKTINDLQKNITQKTNSMEAKVSELSDLKSSSIEKINKLQLSNADLHAKLLKFQTEISNMAETLHEKNETVERLTRDSQLLCAEVKKHNEIIASKSAENEKITRFSEEKARDYKTLRERLDQHGGMLDTVKRELEEKQLECVQQRNQNAELSGKFNSQSKNIEMLSKTVGEMERMIQLKEDNVIEMRNQLKEHTTCKQHICQQSDLIQNLEALQDETQLAMTKLQNSHQEEIKSLQQTIKELSKTNAKQKKLFVKISDENRKLNEVARSDVLRETRSEMEACVNCLNLSKQLAASDRKCEKLCEESRTKLEAKILVPKLQKLKNEKITELSKSAEVSESLLQALKEELEAVQTSSKRRTEQYKNLERSYHLVLEQLKTYEEPPVEALNELNASPLRAVSKSLQNENSSSVWNELEYFKKECECLNVERPELLSLIDDLRMQTTHETTLCNQLKLELLHVNQELEQSGTDAQLKSESISILQKQIEDLMEKVHLEGERIVSKDKEIADLSQNNRSLHLHVACLSENLHRLNHKSISTVSTQTNHQSSEKLFAQVINAVKPSQKSSVTLSTQTAWNPKKLSVCNKATQTAVEECQSDAMKRKHKEQCQHLALLKYDLTHENRSLKKRVTGLESQVKQLRDAKNISASLVSELGASNEKLKEELVSTLHKLQLCRENLQTRGHELDACTQKLHALLQQQNNENHETATYLKEMKSLETKLRLATEECCKISIEAKGLGRENELLSAKVKDDQERITSLEKSLLQKKTYIGELKTKLTNMKRKVDADQSSYESLKENFKVNSERETKNKAYITSLRTKVANLTREKMVLTDNVNSLSADLQSKGKLLDESRRLCKHAESAVLEMERTAFEHLQSQQKNVERKYSEMCCQWKQSCSNVTELKASIKNFIAYMLKEIHGCRKLLVHHRDANKSKFGDVKINEIACSILNMSTGDLKQFMMDEEEPPVDVNDDDILEKLEIILKKESNFSAVLFKLLVDVVTHLHSLQVEVLEAKS